MPDIKSAVKKLCARKSGGVTAVTSDCFIHGTDSLYAFIVMLFNAMLLHGTLKNDFWVSILIPIPKGSRVVTYFWLLLVVRQHLIGSQVFTRCPPLFVVHGIQAVVESRSSREIDNIPQI